MKRGRDQAPGAPDEDGRSSARGGVREKNAVFERLYDTLRSLSFRYALRTLDRDGADAIAAEVGLRLWRAWMQAPEQFADPVAAEGWTVTTTRRVMIDETRKKSARREVAHNLDSIDGSRNSWADPATAAEMNVLYAAIDARLYEMPDERRNAFMRVCEQGQTYVTVGAERGLTPQAVGRQVRIALREMSDALEPLGYQTGRDDR